MLVRDLALAQDQAQDQDQKQDQAHQVSEHLQETRAIAETTPVLEMMMEEVDRVPSQKALRLLTIQALAHLAKKHPQLSLLL
jgi:hypothetical protein